MFFFYLIVASTIPDTHFLDHYSNYFYYTDCYYANNFDRTAFDNDPFYRNPFSNYYTFIQSPGIHEDPIAIWTLYPYTQSSLEILNCFGFLGLTPESTSSPNEIVALDTPTTQEVAPVENPTKVLPPQEKAPVEQEEHDAKSEKARKHQSCWHALLNRIKALIARNP